jgi:HJR/Mrr/RecB family endonuclease
MTIVEWTRLSGDQVEELTAILLCRKYPDALRIRPSSADGGIDLLVPGSEGKSVIYQVKKFTSNISASQKSQIEESLRRFEEYRSEHDLIVES